MNRRRITLFLIAALALVDLLGAAWLRDAWNARHTQAAALAVPSSSTQPARPGPEGEAAAAKAGI